MRGEKIGGELGSPPGGVRLLRFFWIGQTAQIQLTVRQVFR